MTVNSNYRPAPQAYNPFDEEPPVCPGSPTGSELSTLSESVDSSALGLEDSSLNTSIDTTLSSSAAIPSSRICIDPWTAGERIIRFLSKTVRASRAIKEYRNFLITKKAEESPEKTRYHVVTVPIAQYGRVNALIDRWIEKTEGYHKHKDLTSDDEEKLDRSYVILDDIKDQVEIRLHPRRKHIPEAQSLLIATDSKEVEQAIAYITAPHKDNSGTMHLDYEIEFLATSPDNLRLSFQTECMSGAGSALIEEVAFKSLLHTAKREISLEAAEMAIPFYERLGFIQTEQESKMNHFVLSKAHLLKFLTVFGGFALTSI